MKAIVQVFLVILNFSLLASFSSIAHAEIEIDLETTTIKGNTELPKILYIVPWKEIKPSKYDDEQQLVIHSLYGDLFDPVIPQLSSSQ